MACPTARRLRPHVNIMLVAAASLGAALAAQPAPEAVPVRPPVLASRVDAVYPPEALAAGTEADVAVEVTVGADGRVSDERVVASGGEAFDSAALAAVRQWSFRPALQ